MLIIGICLYEDVLPIAGGRIWSGYKALDLGLVDKIGDLGDALDSAAKLAEIEDFQLKLIKNHWIHLNYLLMNC